IFGYGTHYLETIGEVLIEQNVDLVLVGDSHAYAWSYPVTGFGDNNADGKINLDEIQVDSTSDFEFVKGDGFVQTIVGVAGRNLRDDITYPHPALASTYSTVASNGTNRAFPSEFGFAQIHVSDQELVVQYISAESGNIVGDTNGNGIRDAGENAFAEFRIVDPSTSINIDLNDDGVVDALDIDALCVAIMQGQHEDAVDLNRDGEVNKDDYHFMLNDLMKIQPGDANLDGVFNSADLVLVFQAGRFENDFLSAGWQQGDWNCDGKFGSSDLVLVFALGLYQP
ncbi:MAG: hypothetical protein KDA87_17415, partial [Planctomycetales bacterium]|nr:hypothetical protein [Planctomycetales bacterium]